MTNSTWNERVRRVREKHVQRASEAGNNDVAAILASRNTGDTDRELTSSEIEEIAGRE